VGNQRWAKSYQFACPLNWVHSNDAGAIRANRNGLDVAKLASKREMP
jgi:hypothetical protein